LRRRNLLLEEKFLSLDLLGTPSPDARKKRMADTSKSSELTAEQWLIDEGKANVASLRSKLRTVSRENVVLRTENEVTSTLYMSVCRLYVFFLRSTAKRNDSHLFQSVCRQSK